MSDIDIDENGNPRMPSYDESIARLKAEILERLVGRLRARCPFCGLGVLRDDEAQTIAHEEPVCPRFDSVARSGAEQPETRRVQPEAVDAHFSALRARVRNRREIPS